MGVDYHIEDEMVIVSIRGYSPYGEFVEAFDRLMTDPAFYPPAKILLDGRQAAHDPPSDRIKALAEHLGGLSAFHGSQWATVAEPNTLLFGLGRMFCCYAEMQGICIEPFSDFGAARAWLLQTKTESPA